MRGPIDEAKGAYDHASEEHKTLTEASVLLEGELSHLTQLANNHELIFTQDPDICQEEALVDQLEMSIHRIISRSSA